MTELLNRILGRSANFSPEGEGAGGAADAGGTPAGGAPADGTPPEGGENNAGGEQEGTDGGPSVKDILDFDPFEPPAGGQDKKPEGQKPDPKAKVPADAKKTAPNGDALPPSDSKKSSDDPVLRSLQEINDTLSRSQQQPQKVEPGKDTPKGPRFAFDIPPQVSKLLFSEDPEERAAGMGHALNGVANLVYNETMAEVVGVVQNLIRQIPQIVDSRTGEQKSQETAASDFFGRFSNLKKTPQMMNFIAGESKALAEELFKAGNKNLVWNEDFREALGKRIHESLGIPFPEKGQQQQPNGNQKAPKKATFATGGGQRGGQPEVLSEQVKDIMETFS